MKHLSAYQLVLERPVNSTNLASARRFIDEAKAREAEADDVPAWVKGYQQLLGQGRQQIAIGPLN